MMLWLQDDLASRKLLVYRAMLFSLVTLFVLFVFQPFGTTNDTTPYKLLRLSGYGLVTFCALLLAGAIEISLTRLTLNSTLLLIMIPAVYVLITAVFNHGYFVVAVLGRWHWQNQLLFIGYTLAIGLLPISFMLLVNRHAKQTVLTTDTTEKASSNQSVCNVLEGSDVTPPRLITLIGDNKSDRLTVAPADIIFIKSADNYCELAIKENEGVCHTLLRVTLTGLLKQLPENIFIYRCHRSYAVNLELVMASKGNAGGLQLTMLSSDIAVPVSRTYVDAIKQALLLAPKACKRPQNIAISTRE
ncbi:LytTR family transcriptional regulator [Pseudoalteromonas sp. NEC-BIFX-2020_002]|uniref:Histidine kinase n=2 Tax=Pseudoalteromonas TaxID=53246 RepID=A0A0N0M1A6_9GAMM|nr:MULTISPECIES: LytTR family DNA-binding domain-containing protein [Pseudoalteromonas]KPH64998.1 histidine kinase [Pseudoalteromonas porphyrae]NNG43814.1 LytTR family transcriptional regulator [Pseudoalteromonas sp. NEC-BIFX-2020_002]